MQKWILVLLLLVGAAEVKADGSGWATSTEEVLAAKMRARQECYVMNSHRTGLKIYMVHFAWCVCSADRGKIFWSYAITTRLSRAGTAGTNVIRGARRCGGCTVYDPTVEAFTGMPGN